MTAAARGAAGYLFFSGKLNERAKLQELAVPPAPPPKPVPSATTLRLPKKEKR